jgi:oligopeptide/dipeptide ABC transporter ATP-binding protein
MVFQDPFEALNPRQNVYAIVSTPIRHILGEKNDSRIRKTVSDLLNEMELEPSQVMDKFPHQLSGGERQRVNIARALAPKPNLLIADEPITMLDAAQRLSILKLLLELKKNRDLTLIMITHDLASAKVTSDRTLVMYRGKVVEVGRTIDVVTSPHHPYVELIMKSVPQVQKSLEPPSAKSLWSEESANVQGGCIFRLRCEYAQDLCTRVEPPLEEKSNSHFAACHFALNLDHPKS